MTVTFSDYDNNPSHEAGSGTFPERSKLMTSFLSAPHHEVNDTALKRIGFKGSNNLENSFFIINSQIPVRIISNLKKELQVSDEYVSRLIHISKATISRRKEKTLKPEEANRVYRVAALLQLSETVLGTHEKGLQWLKTPKKFLGGEIPLELSKTEAGAEAVKSLLNRLEHSVYS